MGGTPRIGIDARLRAYRGGGIAEHVSRLLDGLAERRPREQLVVLDHRKAPSLPAHPFETRRLWTPPHHRLEGLALPVELIPTRLDLLHCPDVVLPAAWRGAAVVTVHDLAFMRRPELLTTDSRRYYMGVLDSVRRAHRTIGGARASSLHPAHRAAPRIPRTDSLRPATTALLRAGARSRR